MESSLEKKVHFFESERDTISREPRQVFVTNQPRDTGPQLHNCCAKTKEVCSHKWINELMTNFVHRKAHAACSTLHSGLPARLIVSLSHIKEMVQFFFIKQKGSILWVIFCNRRFNSLSHGKNEGLLLGVMLKRRFNSLSQRETLSVGNPDKCLSPNNHETLGHNCTTTCQDKGSVLPQMN